MQPDKPFNYWQNDSDSNQSAPIMPPEPQAVSPIIEPVAAPVSAPGPAPTQMYAPAPPVEEAPELPQPADTEPIADADVVHWSATEYILQAKNGMWYSGLILIAASLIALDIFLLQSYTFSILTGIIVLAIIIYSRRPPAQIDYTLSGEQGLYVGEKLHHFSEFKAFGLVNDNGNNFVMLIPTKRFGLGVSVYFPDEVGEKVIDILGMRLPMESLKLDMVDIIVRKLRL